MPFKMNRMLTKLFPFVFTLLAFFSYPTCTNALPVTEIKLTSHSWVNIGLPIPVLHVEGDTTEQFKAHAELIKRFPQAKQNLKHFSMMIENSIRQGGFFRKHPTLANPLMSALNWIFQFTFISPSRDSIPSDYEKGFLELANAAGLTEREIFNALMLPDQVMWLMSFNRKHEDLISLPPNFGCTSLIWNINHEAVLHGRNLDYDVSGVWDQSPLILHIIPSDGLAHIAITTMGIHTPGITAFNEAGLSLAIHQLGLLDTDNAGVAMPVISAEVIKHARTIDDAIKMIKSYPRSGTWAYVVSQGTDRAVIETSANSVEVRRSSDRFFYQTNHVSSAELEKKQFYYSIGGYLDSFDRGERLRELKIKIGNNHATPQKIISILSDTGGRIAGGTIAKLDNIQSVVMNPSKKSLWIALATTDRSPNENKYVEFLWQDLRSPHSPLIGSTISVPTKSELRKQLHKGANKSSENLSDLIELRIRALAHASPDENLKKIVPGIWAYQMLSIWNELQMHSVKTTSDSAIVPISKDRLDEMLQKIETALRDPLLLQYSKAMNHRKSLVLLFKARLLDLSQKHDQAIPIYREAAELASFPVIRKLAKLEGEKPYEFPQLKTLTIDWPGIDLFHY